VKNQDISKLTSLPELEELNLDSCRVGDWAIAHLADNNVVPNLKTLDLADTEISDIGMIHMPKLQKLTRLSLFYCDISNYGLRHLASMTNLEALNLDRYDVYTYIVWIFPLCHDVMLK
jgi:Leucine-rich repeat (LRR) protein